MKTIEVSAISTLFGVKSSDSKNKTSHDRAMSAPLSPTQHKASNRHPIPSDEEVLGTLSRIRIPSVVLDDVSRSEAIDLLNKLIVQNIAADQHIPKIVLTSKTIQTNKERDKLFESLGETSDMIRELFEKPTVRELRLNDVDLITVLQEVCDATHSHFKIDHGHIVVMNNELEVTHPSPHGEVQPMTTD